MTVVPTPRDAEPTDVNRQRRARQAVAGLEQLGQLPLPAQVEHLERAQRILAEVLDQVSSPDGDDSGKAPINS